MLFDILGLTYIRQVLFTCVGDDGRTYLFLF